ncbi:NUDIX hydrolase [Phycicoccus endophyticus]|uniref:NUDIX hydrolase n=1 Tax=Phycicoccus endophyticus TaxID=1690220 RepID=A0A7G9R463_9MICO|nr:NUDIX hydrolase [Phycicoccus endophyticus]NHI18236.1 NUDIX hydrolase [Phycicoccus endophyticus]QNN50388.1 NUDIX hydrolase [Phycicoccus endophyticus]GGL25301.1 NUDIX hydrolase [Phycicoccus endophyticus]
MPEPLRDRLERRPVLASRRAFEGRVWDVRSDRVDLGEAGVVTRDYVEHTGAVAVLALDEQDRVVVIRQYRHPVGAFAWEIPAGLLDVDGEPAHVTAARELYEEADLRAGRWATLVDHWSSPGGSSESLRIFLARDLEQVPDGERHERTGEELGMPQRRVPLEELVAGVLEGRLHSPTLVIAVLAAETMRRGGWSGLRPAEAPWPERSPGRAPRDAGQPPPPA